jgi:hypothetical protein
MKQRAWIYSLASIALLGSATACSLGGILSSTEPPGDQVATRVAATMAAQGAPSLMPPTAAATSPPTAAPPTALPIVHRTAYIDDGDVWQITPGDPPQKISSSGDAVEVKISDDGQRVVFVRYQSDANTYQIWAVNADGEGEGVLLDQAALDALHPLGGALHIIPHQLEFLPDSHYMLMNTQGTFEGPGQALYEDLLRLHADTGAVTELLPPEQGGTFSISPDGTQVALVQPTSVSLANSDGTNRRADLVTFESIITYSEFLYHPPAVWAPDSSAVGIVIPSHDPLAEETSGTVWRIPADGTPATSLATIEGEFYFTQMGEGGLISPDLSKVVFRRETSPNVYDLYRANSDGSGETVYDLGDVRWMGWSPDSGHFVYVKGANDIYLGRIGTPPLMLGTGTDLRWITPTRYVYLSGTYGAWTLVRGELGAGDTALVSPSGEFVAYDFN